VSVAVLDRGIGADAVPPYVGETANGESATGRDTDLLARKIVRFGIAGWEYVSEVERSGALARFSKFAAAVRDLLKAPARDDLGPIRASKTSVTHAISILFPLVQVGFKLPEPLDIGTDHDGAIRVTWENGPRFLELVVPYEANVAAYLYYSEGDHYDLERTLASDALRRRFNWLRGGSTDTDLPG
jgi:hypothetical protein